MAATSYDSIVTNPAAIPDAADLSATLARLADRCVLCGLCLPHCPTYETDRQESESPRGRISLIHALAENRIDPANVDFAHLDHCLDCRRCEVVCPAKVNYGALLSGGRQLQRQRGHAAEPVWLKAVGALLARPRLLDRLLGLARPIWRLLPQRWRKSLPAPPSRQALTRRSDRHAAPRTSTALFLGCVARRYATAAQQAAIDLLQALGHEVNLPVAQTCCGAQATHAGQSDRAEALKRKNQLAFDDAVRVATLDSGCHEALADSLQAETIDILDLLDRDEAFDRLIRHGPTQRIAVFAPCTQRNVVRSDAALHRLFARLPGVETVWLDTGCCGAAGDHMLRFPDRATALREPLLQQLIDSGCEELLVANTGCRLHLQAGIEQRGLDIDVRHPVEWLAERLLPATPEIPLEDSA